MSSDAAKKKAAEVWGRIAQRILKKYPETWGGVATGTTEDIAQALDEFAAEIQYPPTKPGLMERTPYTTLELNAIENEARRQGERHAFARLELLARKTYKKTLLIYAGEDSVHLSSLVVSSAFNPITASGLAEAPTLQAAVDLAWKEVGE